MSPTLYTFSESGNSYKARLIASLLQIDISFQDIDVLAGAQHSPAFLALNPRAQLPVLKDGDLVLSDSAAILIYLAGMYPDCGSTTAPSSFWSKDIVEQAKITEWLAFAASWIQYGVFTARAIVAYGGNYNGMGPKITEGGLEEARVRSHKSLEILEERLGREESGGWLALGRLTIADISVFPYVALAPMGDIDLGPYKRVREWIERIKGLEGFVTMNGIDDPTYLERKEKKLKL